MKLTNRILTIAIATLAIVWAPVQGHASGVLLQTADSGPLQESVQKKLSNGHFKNVTVQVKDGVVTLGGTVDLYEYKASADDKAHHVKGVTAVDNEIQVTSAKPVNDQQLGQELAKKLAYDRAGWPDQAFNNITLSVSNGVVTLGGNAEIPWAKESALAVAKNTAGVVDVIDDVNVDPVSMMDNQTRIALYRTIYGQPVLNKYAADPAKPIRITVINGNVTLNGVVDNEMDKNIAGIQANTVPGVFKVTNDLVVANQKNEK
jgi:osmotically-inducible protein OsmY